MSSDANKRRTLLSLLHSSVLSSDFGMRTQFQ